MPEIIHCPDIKRLLKFTLRRDIPCLCIILDHNKSENLSKYKDILKLKGISELKAEEISDEEKAACEKEYVNSIAELSSYYNSVQWWANPISEKNEHISSHYKNLCLYYSLIKTLKKYSNILKCIFIVCNDEILEQLKVYCKDNNITIVLTRTSIVLWSKRMFKNLYALFKVMFFLSKIVVRKILIPKPLKLGIENKVGNAQDCYVIRTWLDDRFLKTDSLYNDPYFGRLPAHVISQGYKLLILAGILNSYAKIVKKIKDFIIIPEEYFFKYTDFFHLLSFFFFGRKKIAQKVLFNGLDVTEIYKREIKNGYFTTAYVSNIFRYFVAKRFAEVVNFKMYIQTFENYAWEKMTIMGMRNSGNKGRILGFQHAFISRNSFKYFPGKREKGIVPLPDKIITMGDATKRIMERYGSYVPHIFSVGCALRQEYLKDIKPFKRRRYDKVVVPLTMVRKESLLILKFLYDSGLPETQIRVIVRCHPASPFNTFRKYINFKIPDNFIVNNEKKVAEELSDTDLVFYTWTTVAVEALKMGLPVIYLDILRPMYVDPLFECLFLRRTVSHAKDLLQTISELYSMKDAEFYHEQVLAQKYLEDYFYPVTERNLSPFVYPLFDRESKEDFKNFAPVKTGL